MAESAKLGFRGKEVSQERLFYIHFNESTEINKNHHATRNNYTATWAMWESK